MLKKMGKEEENSSGPSKEKKIRERPPRFREKEKPRLLISDNDHALLVRISSRAISSLAEEASKREEK